MSQNNKTQQEILAQLNKSLSQPGPTALSASLARLLYVSQTDRDVRWLYLGWIVDHFIAYDIHDHTKQAFECYQLLTQYKHTETNQFEYNDMDCYAFTVPWKDNNAFVHIDQNRTILYALRPNPLFSEKGHDIVSHRGWSQNTIFRIYRAHHVHERDKLLTWKKIIKNNGTRYEDSRDEEFLACSGDFSPKEVPLTRAYEVRWSLFNIETLHTALTEEH